MRQKAYRRLHHITRMDYHRATGWWVRFQLDGFSKLFSDGRYGGKAKSLVAATAYRDKVMKKTTLRFGFRQRFNSKRTSTENRIIIGVTYRTYLKYGWYKRFRTGPYVVEEYGVTWVDPVSKKQKRRAFSIKKHGKQEARRLAIAVRVSELKKIKAFYAK